MIKYHDNDNLPTVLPGPFSADIKRIKLLAVPAVADIQERHFGFGALRSYRSSRSVLPIDISLITRTHSLTLRSAPPLSAAGAPYRPGVRPLNNPCTQSHGSSCERIRRRDQGYLFHRGISEMPSDRVSLIHGNPYFRCPQPMTEGRQPFLQRLRISVDLPHEMMSVRQRSGAVPPTGFKRLQSLNFILPRMLLERMGRSKDRKRAMHYVE